MLWIVILNAPKKVLLCKIDSKWILSRNGLILRILSDTYEFRCFIYDVNDGQSVKGTFFVTCFIFTNVCPPSLCFPQGVILTIWRTTSGRHVSTMSTASSRPSSSPLRQKPQLATATASSPTSVQWAPCCCCCRPSSAQWSMPSWWVSSSAHVTTSVNERMFENKTEQLGFAL